MENSQIAQISCNHSKASDHAYGINDETTPRLGSNIYPCRY